MPWSVPLWVCFVLTVLAFTGAFTASLWTTLNGAAVSSVEDLSTVFQTNVMHDLRHRLQGVPEGMFPVLNSWRAIPEVGRSTMEEVFSYTYSVMNGTTAVEGMVFAQPDGTTMGCSRKSSGTLLMNYRPGSALITPLNLTFWNFNGSLGNIYRTVLFEPRVRPWYVAAVATPGPVFTNLGRSSVLVTETLVLSTAVFHSNGTLAGVLGVFCPYSVLSDELTAALSELRSSGMLLLMDQSSGLPIAQATASPATLHTDIAEVQGVMREHLQNFDVHHRRLQTFGDSTVLHVLISAQQGSGLQWRLVVVLPDSDYYSRIWRQNIVAGAESG
eukprot:RCo054782